MLKNLKIIFNKKSFLIREFKIYKKTLLIIVSESEFSIEKILTHKEKIKIFSKYIFSPSV